MEKLFSEIDSRVEIVDFSNKNDREMVHVVFGVDNLFVEPMAVCALSIIKMNQNLRVIIHVIIDEISPQNRSYLKSLAKDNEMCFFFHFINTNTFKGLPSTLSYTRAIYNRLLIPFIINSDVDRVLYLDADILCFGSIAELFSLNLDRAVVAAVEDHSWDGKVNRISPHKLQQEGFSCNHYFNTGVMLIDLLAWKKEKISQKALYNLNRYNDIFTLPDQDALNSVLGEHVLLLDRKYNYMYSVDNPNIPMPNFGDIVLLHYTNRCKLWQAWCSHPLQNTYIRLRNETAWKDKPLLMPQNYKDMRSMSRYFKRKHQYVFSLLWLFKYCAYKIKERL